VRYIAL